MRVIGKEVIDAAVLQHADARNALLAFLAEVQEATWQTPHDLRNRYPSASILPNHHIIFNIRGNTYRLDALVYFDQQTVIINRFGTHDKYNSWTFDE